MVLDFLRRLWYDREVYLELAGDELLQRLKHQGVFESFPNSSFISIEPVSRQYVVRPSLAEAISTGYAQWGHMDFYCTPIDSPPVQRPVLPASQIQRKGERVLRHLRRDGLLDSTGGSFIAIEVKQGCHLTGDSLDDVIKRGKETWPGSRMYVRRIEEYRLPQV